MQQGIIVKILPGSFEVLLENGQRMQATAKGKLKLGTKLMLGDNVEIENGIICAIHSRRNYLQRPECCNIDNFVIVLACEPEPDFNLTDLLIALCFKQNINVSICINKDDISKEGFLEGVKKQYGGVVPIEVVSARLGTNMPQLKNKLAGTTVFAGQSGVGKTSIINSIFGLDLAVGDISAKIKRGANTTTQAYFHVSSDGRIVVDTPGFNYLDILKLGLTEQEYKKSFLEFWCVACKYVGCTHTGEDGCGLDAAIAGAKVSSDRAGRYRAMFAKLNEAQKRRFK